jgi:hypothetical protein
MSEVARLSVSPHSLGELREAVAAADAELLWIVDSQASPEPGALEALTQAGVRPAASLPVDRSGAIVEELIGGFTKADVELVVAAARRRELPLRHTHLLSLLVERRQALEIDPPDPRRYGPYAASEWTARLMAGRPGVLVPASRVRVPDRRRTSLASALRTARTGTWQRAETAREVARALRS